MSSCILNFSNQPSPFLSQISLYSLKPLTLSISLGPRVWVRKNVRTVGEKVNCEVLTSGHSMAIALFGPQQVWLPAHDLYKIQKSNIQCGWERGPWDSTIRGVIGS